MKNRLLSFAGALALLAVMGKFYAPPLLAQVRAALTKNVDERGRNPYTQSLACYSANTNQCAVFFPSVPANKELVVEHISISVDTPTPLIDMDFYGNGAQASALMTQQGTDAAGNMIYVGNQPLLAYFSAGQAPTVAVNTKAGSFEFVSGTVTVTGYLVDLTL